MPRIAPPPLGREIDGALARKFESALGADLALDEADGDATAGPYVGELFRSADEARRILAPWK